MLRQGSAKSMRSSHEAPSNPYPHPHSYPPTPHPRPIITPMHLHFLLGNWWAVICLASPCCISPCLASSCLVLPCLVLSRVLPFVAHNKQRSIWSVMRSEPRNLLLGSSTAHPLTSSRRSPLDHLCKAATTRTVETRTG